MTADELLKRVKQLRMSHAEAAKRLGLTPNGLFKQMHGERPVSRQTELLLPHVEREQPPKRVEIQVKVTPLLMIERPARTGKPAKPRRLARDLV